MKKVLIIILKVIIILALIPALFLGIFKLIEHYDYKNTKEKLDKYEFVKDEKIVKEFKHKNYNYVITKYYGDNSSWSNLNILLKDKEEYRALTSIEKCDTLDDGKNLYVRNNNIYIHCIGKTGDILNYKLNGASVSNETLFMNYSETPNISLIHITIDKVDDDDIYMESSVKNNDDEKSSEKIKCSLSSKKCVYTK